MTNNSTIKDMIVLTLDQCGEVNGVFVLGYRLIGTHNLCWLRDKLNELVNEGAIEIKDNGIGKPKTIRKINRNSPGYPRRRV